MCAGWIATGKTRRGLRPLLAIRESDALAEELVEVAGDISLPVMNLAIRRTEPIQCETSSPLYSERAITLQHMWGY